MKGTSAFATFAVTTAVIGVIIGLSLRSGSAQFGPTSGPAVVHFSTFSIARGDTAHVFFTNLSRDTTRPPARFATVYLDQSGTPLKSMTCEVPSGQTCDMSFAFSDGCTADPKGACELRAETIVEPMPLPQTSDGGVTDPGQYVGNLTIQDKDGHPSVVTGPAAPAQFPVLGGGTTDGGAF